MIVVHCKTPICLIKPGGPGGGGGGRQKNTDLEHLEAKLGVLSGGCSSSTGLAFVQ